MEEFSCENFTYRRLSLRDQASLFLLHSHGDTMKWTSFEKDLNKKESLVSLNKTIAHDSHGAFGIWGLFDQENQLIVWLMLKDTGLKFYEAGYMVNFNFWRQGFATKVLSDIITYAKAIGLAGVSARVQVENFISITLLENQHFRITEKIVNLSNRPITLELILQDKSGYNNR